MKKLNKLILMAVVLPALLWASCKVERITPPKEGVKDIAGTWKVIKAVRNGAEVTNSFDFTTFKVTFTADNKYTLENHAPFLVKKDGSFSLDDPLYPYEITLNPGSAPVTTNFEYPMVNGVREMRLTFSPGCNLNSYTYILRKAN